MKKDKKTPEEEQKQNEEALEKDYQQEEDEDVKEKHKITKVIIAIILFIAIIFIFLLMRHIKNESAEKFYDVEGVPGTAAASSDEDSNIGDIEGCLLDLSGSTVVVTIPLEYYEDNPPADTLSDIEKAKGYVDVKKFAGNVIYTIKTSSYRSIVSGIYESHADEYQEDAFLKENDMLCFAQFSYMQRFTVTIKDNKNFSANKYYKFMEHWYYQSAIYQSYLGILPSNIKTVFQFKNTGAQFTFAEYPFPQLKGKDLSSVAISNKEGTAPGSAAKRFGFDK